MKCINCGKFPFCNKIQDSQQEACEEFIKRLLEIEIKRKEENNSESRRRNRTT